MNKKHEYKLMVKWTGNTGNGTSDYRTYSRNHTVSVDSKQDIFCSSDPAFYGDNTKFNPEELFLASISACHMLWFLHLCADSGIIVTEYSDNATGVMHEMEGNGGHFTEVTLFPIVVVKEKGMVARANELHNQANKFCFIGNSCNFPIKHKPICNAAED